MSRPSHAPALDIGPLSWVIDEVRASLGNSIGALKAYAASTDSTQLRFAKNHLHQAHGALQIVDLDGIAIITEQAEALLEKLDQGTLTCDATLIGQIEHAFGGLLDYLDDLLSGNDHQPIRLYPHVRDLLRLNGAERIHPGDLLFPDMTVRITDVGSPAAHDAVLPPVRARFERGLLGFLRGVGGAPALADMASAVAAVRDAQTRGSSRSFWTVMSGLFEALEDPTVKHDLNLKRLCARINLQMRRTIDGTSALPERLLKDALFYVGLSTARTPIAQRVRDAFGLAGAIPHDYEHTRYGRIDPQLIKRSKDQLSALKAAWDRLMGGQVAEAAAFERQAELFAQVCQQLDEPALLDIAHALQAIAQRVSEAKALPAPAIGMEAATSVLFVENALETFNRLDDDFPQRARLVAERLRAALAGQPVDESVDWLAELSRRSHERATMATLVTEIQTNLRAIEQTLDAFFRDNNKRDALGSTLPLLDQTAGALLLLGHESAHAAIEFVRAAIVRFQQPGYSADTREFERVAQSFGALGFFIDALRQPDNAVRPSLEFDPHEGAYVARLTLTDTSNESPLATTPEVVRTQLRTALRAGVPEAHETPPALDPSTPLVVPGPSPTIAATAPSVDDFPVLIPSLDFDADQAATATTVDAGSVEREVHGRIDAVLGLLETLRTRPTDAEVVQRLRDQMTEVRQGAELLDDARLVGLARQALAQLGAWPATGDVTAVDALAQVLAELRPDKPLKEAPAPDASTLALAASDDAVIDAELLSIFLGEAKEVFETIDAARERSMANPSNLEHLTTLRRAFHTLKGSSRMVGLRIFGEAAWAVEQVFNLWLSEERAGTPALFALAGTARELMAQWVERIEADDRAAVRPEALIAAAERVKAGQDFFLDAEEDAADEPPSAQAGTALDMLESAPAASDDVPADVLADVLTDVLTDVSTIAPDAGSPDVAPGDLTLDDLSVAAAAFDGGNLDLDSPLPELTLELPTLDVAGLDVQTVDVPTLDEPVPEEAALAAPVVEEVDAAPGYDTKRIGDLSIPAPLFSIYLGEAEDRLRGLTEELAQWRHYPAAGVSERAIRSVHSLSGASATAGVGPVHDVAAFLEQVLVAVQRAPVDVSADEFDKLDHIAERIRGMLHQFAAEIFPAAEPGTLAAIDELRVAWQMRQQTPLQLVVVSSQSTPSEAEAAGADDALEAPAESAITAPTESPIDAAIVAPVETLEEALIVDAPAAQAVDVAYDGLSIDLPADVGFPVSTGQDESARGVVTEGSSAPAPESVLAPVDDSAHDLHAHDDDSPKIVDELDPELFELFVAEANDYLPRIGENLRRLSAAPNDLSPLAEVLRHLHTVKGSARMAGAMKLGARFHELETRAGIAQEVPTATLFDDLLSRYDEVVAHFESLVRGGTPAPEDAAPVAETTSDVSQAAVAPPATEGESPSAAPALTLVDVAPAEPAGQPPAPTIAATGAMIAAAPAALGDGAVSAAGQRNVVHGEHRRGQTGALVRVKSETLDRLVNQAGEVAIARARLANDLGSVRTSLTDLTENVGRLRTQLREIEIAAEAQMQSRIEAQRSHGGEFDPLEFDRYTRLQELTRMMAESVNDVAMVQQNIVRNLEGAGKDLTNQARLTRDLQQDLMRVRMVPVDSVADRLYRIVRQSAKETGKRVALGIVGGNVELDRGVLERMVGPFEHLLRNAVVHGIESREQRLATGKSEAGTVTLTVRHEGNEVLLEFTDDGAGLNLERIRQKAVERGLLPGPDAVSDAEAAALIFEAGFSTAQEVTELAGRGVGMDVVQAEASALGGRVEVQTSPGRGTRFAIRLPLTLAVTQVVLVRAGGRVYALPSVLIEQVQQLRPPVLAGAYNDGTLMVLGERVQFAYLPLLLGDTRAVPVAQRYSPVVGVRSGGQRVALHVDEVIGNQEVVVKNVGPQLARMIGIAGATVLGSGEIVLILDPVQLVGRVALQHVTPVASATGAVGEIINEAQPPRTDIVGMSHAPVVMVVDDSVTVRRVTQRLLVREGYQVVLAKDGVDALEQMQDFAPDIMLVDIEMPRMDGFDLTRNVRTDPRFKDTPIIMITSRTADKHRNMAMSLGVNVYLGKPYQEDELLLHIHHYLGQTASHPA